MATPDEQEVVQQMAELEVSRQLREAVINRVIATLKARSTGVLVEVQNELHDIADEAGMIDESKLEQWLRDDATEIRRVADRMNELGETLMERLHTWKESEKAD